MITIVNLKHHSGPCFYIGRKMRCRAGSPLGNPFKRAPGISRDALLEQYRQWLWRHMRVNDGNRVITELRRLAEVARTDDLYLACWCAPKTCHGDIIKKAIEWLNGQSLAPAQEERE